VKSESVSTQLSSETRLPTANFTKVSALVACGSVLSCDVNSKICTSGCEDNVVCARIGAAMQATQVKPKLSDSAGADPERDDI